MTAFLATLHDLRYVIAAALLIWAAAWTIAKVYGWSCAEVDRMVAEALDSISLDDLVDGYVDSLDAWAAEPLCKGMSDEEAVLFAAAVLSDIDELTREAS